MLSASASPSRGIHKQRFIDVTGFRAESASCGGLDTFEGNASPSNITISMELPSGAIASRKNRSRDSSVSILLRASPKMMKQRRLFMMLIHDCNAGATISPRTVSDSAEGSRTCAMLEQRLAAHDHQRNYQTIGPHKHGNRDIEGVTALASSQSDEQGHWMSADTAITASDQHDLS